MAYQKPATVCMSLFGGPAVCNDDPILLFIPLIPPPPPPPNWMLDTPVFVIGDAVQSATFTNFGANVDLAKTTKDRAIVSNQGYSVVGDGAAHIFTYDGVGTWTIEQTIQTPAGGTNFGTIVTMSGDGSRCAITQATPAVSQVNIFVYSRSGTTWTLLDTITTTYSAGTNTNSMAMSSDGDTIACANNSSSGQIQIYKFNGSTFDLEFDFALGNNKFGAGIGISENGEYLVVPEGGVSKFYVYSDNARDGSWVLRNPGGDTNFIGSAVGPDGASISNDGGVVSISANSSTMNVWFWDGDDYIKTTDSQSVSDTVKGVSVSSDGSIVAIIAGGSTGDGQVEIWSGDASVGFTLDTIIVQPSDPYGASSGTMSYDGRMVFAGSEAWNSANSFEGRFFSYDIPIPE